MGAELNTVRKLFKLDFPLLLLSRNMYFFNRFLFSYDFWTKSNSVESSSKKKTIELKKVDGNIYNNNNMITIIVIIIIIIIAIIIIIIIT